MRHPTEETRLFLKSLGKMLFKNPLRDSLALICYIWLQSSVRCFYSFQISGQNYANSRHEDVNKPQVNVVQVLQEAPIKQVHNDGQVSSVGQNENVNLEK